MDPNVFSLKSIEHWITKNGKNGRYINYLGMHFFTKAIFLKRMSHAHDTCKLQVASHWKKRKRKKVKTLRLSTACGLLTTI